MKNILFPPQPHCGIWMEGIRKVFGGYSEGIRKVFGRYLEGIRKVYGRYSEDIWKVLINLRKLQTMVKLYHNSTKLEKDGQNWKSTDNMKE